LSEFSSISGFPTSGKFSHNLNDPSGLFPKTENLI
jgi:hypothetical protein